MFWFFFFLSKRFCFKLDYNVDAWPDFPRTCQTPPCGPWGLLACSGGGQRAPLHGATLNAGLSEAGGHLSPFPSWERRCNSGALNLGPRGPRESTQGLRASVRGVGRVSPTPSEKKLLGFMSALEGAERWRG